MLKILENNIRLHFKDNLSRYILTLIVFLVGILAGSYVAMTYSSDELGPLVNFLDDFLKVYKGEAIDYNLIFKSSLLSSLKVTFVMWILGFTIIGVIGIFILVLRRGFMLGYIVALFIKIYGVTGGVIGGITSFVQCLFYIPVMFLVSVYGIQLSVVIIRMLSGKMKYKTNIKAFILEYIGIFVLCVFILSLYALSEAYLGANLIKWFINLT